MTILIIDCNLSDILFCCCVTLAVTSSFDSKKGDMCKSCSIDCICAVNCEKSNRGLKNVLYIRRISITLIEESAIGQMSMTH